MKKISWLSSSSSSFPLNDSMCTVSQGLPGSMNSVPKLSLPSHSRTALAQNSGPLSDRMCAGIPRPMNRSAKV